MSADKEISSKDKPLHKISVIDKISIPLRGQSILSNKQTEEPRKKVLFATKSIAATISRHDLLRITMLGFFVQLIYLFVATTNCLGFQSMSTYYMNRAIKEHFMKDVEVSDERTIQFANINTMWDIWKYMENVFVPNIFASRIQALGYNRSTERESSLYVNTLLGRPRIRQVMVVNGSCLHWKSLDHLRSSCFGPYMDKHESKNTFGVGNSRAWRYSSAKMTGERATGKLFHYSGGGFFIDLPLNKKMAENMVDYLKGNMWIDAATRAIFLKASFYNANMNLFCYASVLFEILATGTVRPSTRFDTVQLVKYTNSWEWFVLFCTYAYHFLAFVYMLLVVREAFYFKSRIYKQFWAYVDVAIFIFALVTMKLHIEEKNLVKVTLERLKKFPDRYGNIEHATYHSKLTNHLTAMGTFLVYVRSFQYLNICATMDQLNRTMRKCAYDVGMFIIIYMIIFIAFCHSGYLLLGDQLESFSTIGFSMFTLFKMMFGNFNYDEIGQVAPVNGACFFVLFTIIGILILLNLLLSIISETYADVRTDVTSLANETHVIDLIKTKLKTLFMRCGMKVNGQKQISEENIIHGKIKYALERCGFSPLEIDMFFTRYNIDPVAEVGDYDIEEIISEVERRQKLQDLRKYSRGAKREEDIIISTDDFKAEGRKLDEIDKTLEKLQEKVAQLFTDLDEKIELVKRKSIMHF